MLRRFWRQLERKVACPHYSHKNSEQVALSGTLAERSATCLRFAEREHVRVARRQDPRRANTKDPTKRDRRDGTGSGKGTDNRGRATGERTGPPATPSACGSSSSDRCTRLRRGGESWLR